VRKGAAPKGYSMLPKQERPVIINTKGPSASAKAPCGPCKESLQGTLACAGRTSADQPRHLRKQLLDYARWGLPSNTRARLPQKSCR